MGLARLRGSFTRSSGGEDRRTRLEAFPGWTWDLRADSWERAFGLLEAFAKREGHARPKPDHVEAGLRLGRWVSKQRTPAKLDLLSKEQAARLESLPGWAWDAHAARWENAYLALTRFAMREGHASPPQGLLEDSLPLGDWVNSQRAFYSRDVLSAERRRLLEQVPTWTWTPNESQWETAFAALEAFVRREKHASPAGTTVESGVAIGGWVSRQRQARKRGTLSADRVSQLEALPGWRWKAGPATWESVYALLVKKGVSP